MRDNLCDCIREEILLVHSSVTSDDASLQRASREAAPDLCVLL